MADVPRDDRMGERPMASTLQLRQWHYLGTSNILRAGARRQSAIEEASPLT